MRRWCAGGYALGMEFEHRWLGRIGYDEAHALQRTLLAERAEGRGHDTLLTLEQVTTSLTVLALSACRDPKQSPRLRALLDDLVGLIQECEDELALNDR